MASAGRKRVLLVNAYLDDARAPTRRATTVLKSLGPVQLAGAFDRGACDVRLWDEQSSGPLEDEGLLGWPDMLVLTGMTSGFDRMLHLCAYARSKQPRVIVVAGGPAIRALPQWSRQFFDYCCHGDVEELLEVVDEAWGPAYADRAMVPRYDLAYWMGRFGCVESTRYCNFACSFCSLTGEGRRYRTLGVERLRREIVAGGRRSFLLLLDNNFYGNDRADFAARVALLGAMRQEGWFRGFGALVTSDLFAAPQNLAHLRAAGCEALFCGIESFAPESIARFNKKQNARVPQVELISGCLEAGILLIYGMIADVTRRSVASLRRELDFVLGCPDITLPSFVVLPIPFPRTPFFRECVRDDLLLPHTKLRDLDGTTLCVRPVDPLDEVAAFVRDLQTMRGRRWAMVRHGVRFLGRHARHLRPRQLATMLLRDVALAGFPSPSAVWARWRRKRTHVSTTEPLDALYRPAFPVEARFARYFEPTCVTDGRGRLVEAIAAELLGDGRSAVAAPVAERATGTD